MSAHPMQRAPHAHLPCTAAVYCNGRAATTSGGRRRQHVHVGKRATTCRVLCMPRGMLHDMPCGILHVASKWAVKGCMPGVMLYASRHLESARVRSPPPPQPGRFVRQRCRVQRPSHRLPPHERRPALAHLSSRSRAERCDCHCCGPTRPQRQACNPTRAVVRWTDVANCTGHVACLRLASHTYLIVREPNAHLSRRLPVGTRRALPRNKPNKVHKQTNIARTATAQTSKPHRSTSLRSRGCSGTPSLAHAHGQRMHWRGWRGPLVRFR